ncbi:MAG: ABC transporter permease [Rhizobiales bacterium]|nr:ABC transporter permease [Hyphomicrobiales bacterium]
MSTPGNNRRHWELWISVLPFALLLVLFLIGPMVLTPLLTFQETKLYQLRWTWSFDTWSTVLSNPTYSAVLLRTVWTALLSTIVCVVVAYPVAYALNTRLAAWSNQVQILIIFAFLTDAVLKTFGWVLFLDVHGVGNWLLQKLGFGPGATNILFTPKAAMLGIVYNLAPYPIFTIYLSLARIDPDLKHAAYDAGASKLRTFLQITLPLSLPGAIAGALLVFVLSLGTFLESKVLGGGTKPLASELIRQTFETRVNWPLGAALTFSLVLVALAALLGLVMIGSRLRIGAAGRETS